MKQNAALRRRLNFIPEELRPAFPTPKDVLVIVAVVLIALPLLAGAAHAVRWTLERTLGQVTAVRDTLAAEVAKKVAARDGSSDKLAASAVKKALSEKLYWADVFKELTNLAPKTVWLTAFDTAAGDAEAKPDAKAEGKKVVIAGLGTSQADIADFYAHLEKSYFFRYIEIKFTEMTDINGDPAYRFQFEGRVFDEPKGGGNGAN